MGNVYSSLDKISLRFRQNDLQDFDYARAIVRLRHPLPHAHRPLPRGFLAEPEFSALFRMQRHHRRVALLRVRARPRSVVQQRSMFSNSTSRWGRRFDEKTEARQSEISGRMQKAGCFACCLLPSAFCLLIPASVFSRRDHRPHRHLGRQSGDHRKPDRRGDPAYCVLEPGKAESRR